MRLRRKERGGFPSAVKRAAEEGDFFLEVRDARLIDPLDFVDQLLVRDHIETVVVCSAVVREEDRLVELGQIEGLLQHRAARRFTARRLALLRPTSSKTLHCA